MIRRLALCLTLIGLAACQPDAGPGGVVEGGDCPGGTVVHGMAGPTCAKPTPDAGKACKKASDCSGHCMADSMTCSALTPQFGCFDMRTEDGQKVGLCVD
jgi:hypothetical protein